MGEEEKVLEEIIEVEGKLTDQPLKVEEVEEEESLPKTIVLGDVEYNLYKKGGEQAQQVSDLLNWLGKYGEGLAGALVGASDSPDAFSLDVWSLIAAIGKVSSKEALIDLFVVVIGCTPKVAEEYFNIGTLIDGVQILFSQEEYVKVFNRFF